MTSRNSAAKTRELLKKHWSQLADNLDAELILDKLCNERVITRDEATSIRAADSRLDQTTLLLTILKEKSIEDFLAFAKILTKRDSPLKKVGKSILQAAHDSKIEEDVSRETSVTRNDVACQTTNLDRGLQSGGSVVTIISFGVAGLIGAIIIHLVMRNDQLQQTVSSLEKAALEYDRVIANLSELLQESATLEETPDRFMEEKLQLTSLIDRLNTNLTNQASELSLLEQKKQTLERSVTDISDVVRTLSVKLSKVVAENRDLKRRRSFYRLCVRLRTSRLNRCMESVEKTASSLDKERETLLSENAKLKAEIAEMTSKLFDALQAQGKLVDETKRLNEKLEVMSVHLERPHGGGKHCHGKDPHHHHHHNGGHHRGGCHRKRHGGGMRGRH